LELLELKKTGKTRKIYSQQILVSVPKKILKGLGYMVLVKIPVFLISVPSPDLHIHIYNNL